MPKYIFLYRGEATPMGEMTQEQTDAEMAKWGAWMERVGPALKDPGSPFSLSTSVVDDGTEAQAGDLTGYSIVEADSLDAAKAFTDGHPFLSEGKGNFAVDVFEMIDMAM